MSQKRNRPLLLSGLLFFSNILLSGSDFSLAGVPLQKQDRPDEQKIRREEEKNYYKKWLQEDVVYIVTEEEKAIFQKLTTDDERDAFIEQFWLRRDSDQRSAINEFKEEHYRRIAYANEHFYSGEPGWKTDRGEMYIKFGPPNGRETYPNGGPYARRLDEGGGTTVTFPFERWRYNNIDGVGPNIEIEFVDPSRTGEYRIALSPQEKDALLHVATTWAGQTEAEAQGLENRWLRITRDYGLGIQARSPYYTMHPDDFPFEKQQRIAALQKAPSNVNFRGLRQEVQTLISYERLPFRVSKSYVQLTPSSFLVPITVQIENHVLDYKLENQVYRTDVEVYGLVTDLSGRILQEFDQQLVNSCRSDELELERQKTSIFQKAVELPAGRYKFEVYIKDIGSKRLGILKESILLPQLEEGLLHLSPIVLADLVEPYWTDELRFEQFTLGNLKVVPNVSRVFSKADNLNIYLQAYGAALDQSSLQPSMSIRYFLLRDSKLVRAFPDAKGHSIQYVSPRRIVLASGFRLSELPEGDYKVVVMVKDNISGQEARSETAFKLANKGLKARTSG